MKQSNFILSLTSQCQLQIYTECWDRNVLYINSRKERKWEKRKRKWEKRKRKSELLDENHP